MDGNQAEGRHYLSVCILLTELYLKINTFPTLVTCLEQEVSEMRSQDILLLGAWFGAVQVGLERADDGPLIVEDLLHVVSAREEDVGDATMEVLREPEGKEEAVVHLIALETFCVTFYMVNLQ
jgi:hypothetical protein